MPAIDNKKIESMVRTIVDRFKPEKVILFGSHAAGSAGPDSDIDLLVVMPVNGSCRKIAMEIDMALADRTVPLDLIVVTPQQFARESLVPGSIIKPAAQQGKILYDNAA